jgi:hypothetical protein
MAKFYLESSEDKLTVNIEGKVKDIVYLFTEAMEDDPDVASAVASGIAMYMHIHGKTELALELAETIGDITKKLR